MYSIGYSGPGSVRYPVNAGVLSPQFGVFWRRSKTKTETQPPKGEEKDEPAPLPSLRKRWFRRIKRAFYATMLVVGLTPGEPAEAPVVTSTANMSPTVRFVQQPGQAKPKVYVLHSGVGDPQNWGASDIRKTLLAEGVPDSNIVVLNNPYPNLGELNDLSLKNFKTIFISGWKRNIQGVFTGKAPGKPLLFKLLETASTFVRSANTDSAVVEARYKEMNDIIQARSGGQPVEVIWVGYSAGGQMGLSVAGKNGKLQDQSGGNHPIDVSTVITLGTPVLENPAPPRTRLIVVQSTGDDFIDSVIHYSGYIRKGLKKAPDNLDSNDQLITVEDLTHTDLPYFKQPLRIALDQVNPKIAAEQIARHPPAQNQTRGIPARPRIPANPAAEPPAKSD